ncbi:uncharacterized protein [Argopecten irradians]|uniref:uncharacterized protein n=1 Tax=Argopecten irradians TaxID=31199 RepID=UPI003720A010
MDAVVRTSVTPSITAKFIRVNPRNWNFHICLRFDVSGCYVPFKGYRRSKRFRMASISNTGALAPYRILQAGVSTFVDCARACTENDRCVSFICLGITCNGYNQYINRSFVSQETPYYYSTINTDRLMYESDHDRKGIYKVNEMRQNRSSAAQGCEQQFTSLIKMSAPQMSFLQAVISSNKVMIQDYRFYVSGHYETDWRYDDGTEISDLSLWSPSQPDPSDGACVMMTQSGLSSVDCSELLFFICHH